MFKINKIISGGQSGVDRAALDFALRHNIPRGGWCPKGRVAEDGIIPENYPLTETPSTDYSQRTEWNVRDSDATLIIYDSEMDEGTLLTRELATKYKKPNLLVDLNKNNSSDCIQQWINDNSIEALNIAGPRESNSPGIYAGTFEFLREFWVS